MSDTIVVPVYSFYILYQRGKSLDSGMDLGIRDQNPSENVWKRLGERDPRNSSLFGDTPVVASDVRGHRRVTGLDVDTDGVTEGVLVVGADTGLIHPDVVVGGTSDNTPTPLPCSLSCTSLTDSTLFGVRSPSGPLLLEFSDSLEDSFDS